MVAAHTNPTRAPVTPVREFLSSLTTYVQKFAQGLQKVKPVGVEINDTPVATDEEESAAEHSANADYIVERFGYPRKDVRQWLATVGYPSEVGLVDLKVVVQTLEYVTLSMVNIFCSAFLQHTRARRCCQPAKGGVRA
jgi:hypothetical protein